MVAGATTPPPCSAPSRRFSTASVLRDLGGVRLLLDQGAPSALLYLRVEDIDTTLERLRAAGVPVESEPHVIFGHDDDTLGPAGTDEWMAFVTDTEGNHVGLVEHRPRR